MNLKKRGATLLTVFSFFWSLEFWGAVLSYNTRRWRQNYIVVGLLILAGVLATIAGPATAVLMIPRKLEWPVGGGIFWINGWRFESRYFLLSTDLSR